MASACLILPQTAGRRFAFKFLVLSRLPVSHARDFPAGRPGPDGLGPRPLKAGDVAPESRRNPRVAGDEVEHGCLLDACGWKACSHHRKLVRVEAVAGGLASGFCDADVLHGEPLVLNDYEQNRPCVGVFGTEYVKLVTRHSVRKAIL